MPFRNHGVFVDEAVASVRAQSHRVNRIVVVDDGSTDPFSLEVLERLGQEPGTEVLRQDNAGPSAARNAGARSSAADAVLFLDSDDLLTERHVEFAVDALGGAPPEVGFSYPDQQCFGTIDSRMIMPPYNLYLLLFRNFVGTGSLVDRSVFERGLWFNEHLLHGHEDWDYFLTLAASGVIGEPFHGAPLHWRRWGYSRSDRVLDERGLFVREVRELHPEIFEPERLIRVKRAWSPALSIVVPSPDTPCSEQTCVDFEIVHSPSGAPLPRVRGRWVFMADEHGAAALAGPTFVERLVRLVEPRRLPVVLGLRAGDSMRGLVAWQRVLADGPGTPLGILADGATYERWRTESPEGGEAVRGILADSVEWCWIGPLPEGSTSVIVPPAVPPPDVAADRSSRMSPGGHDSTAAEDVANARAEGARQEEEFRWQARPLYLPASGLARTPVPPPGFMDGLDALAGRAWGSWSPSQTFRLDLRVDPTGRMGLEAVDDLYDSSRPDVAGVQRVSLGRIWSRKFPGSVGLYDVVDLKTHSVGYVAGRPPTHEGPWSLLGFVAEAQLTDMVSLHEALNAALEDVRLSGRNVLAPSLVVDGAGAFLEPPGPASSLFRRRSWPLYEIDRSDGSYRYSTNPDRWAAWETRTPTVTAVAALPVDGADSMPASLHEIRYVDSESFGYVSGPVELAAMLAVASDQAVLGDVTERPRRNLPLVRLRPGPGCLNPVPPGHRLAVDWQPVVGEGYEPEGVVGFVDPPNNDRLPLFRWRSVADGTLSALTLGRRPDQLEGWKFDATIGMAWRPDVRLPGLIDLYELRRGPLTTYASDPSEFEAAGFAVHRVLCRIHEAHDLATIPLVRLVLDDRGPWLISVSHDERVELGYVMQRVLGYVDPGVPPMSATTACSAIPPDWAATVAFIEPRGRDVVGFVSREPFRGSVAVVDEGDGSIGVRTGPFSGSPRVLGHAASGPTAFGIPLYKVRPRVGGESYLTSNTPDRSSGVIEDAACYLFTPESTPPGEAAAEASIDGPIGNPETRPSVTRWRRLRAGG